jgi:hypothetical protein
MNTIGHNSLPDLAARINEQHAGVLGSLQTALSHAMDAGDLLLEAKDKAGHGNWLPWLKANAPLLSERTARHYMRLARGREELAKSANVADLTVSGALDLLTAPAPTPIEVRLRNFLLELADIDPRIKVSLTGMKLPKDLAFEQWVSVMQLIHTHWAGEIARVEEERKAWRR